jgi:hypothetical protein
MRTTQTMMRLMEIGMRTKSRNKRVKQTVVIVKWKMHHLITMMIWMKF